jgi:alpha-amylase
MNDEIRPLSSRACSRGILFETQGKIPRQYARDDRFFLPLVALALLGFISRSALAVDVSPPAILQAFENSYSGLETRMPDIFAAGYGMIYTPPPGRADSGNQSVGYDQYDRFDLGSAGNPTLYGTETGLRTVINAAHGAGINYGLDLVWNHSGFSDKNTASGSFLAAGGYPGFNLNFGTDSFGDYHDYSATGDQNMRLAGLIDIDHGKNYLVIRSPVNASDSQNIKAGAITWNGRKANVADPKNARFYPDRNLTPITYNDAGQTVTVYPFNNANPMAGDATPESALGYLMRNTQWYVQSLGVDFFRLDATKNYPSWVLNYYDRAVYRASLRPLLDGSQRNVFAFGEYYDGNANNIVNADVVRKDISNAATLGGNRDSLDFPLFFALRDNLSGNGLQNDWRNVYQASLDYHADPNGTGGGLLNGSMGVKFVESPDNGNAVYLDNVAYAYTLMMPGNALVYSNPHEFGNGHNFPAGGRGDTMGGLYGDRLTTLVTLRNEYGRGNYRTRLIEKEDYAFERSKSAIVLLSNRGDSGFDARTIPTDFEPGQFLIELTGNAASATEDLNNDIPELLTVNADRTVNVRFHRNGTTHNGYLVYGLPTPQGSMTTSGSSSTLAGWDMNTTGLTADQISKANATKRVADVNVFTGNSFDITLHTNKVNLLGNPAFRDHDADGDNALLRIDAGLDLNGNGTVDFRTSGDYKYGYENFTTVKQPGYTSVDNNGTYTQTIDATQLSEGYHSISAIALRHRTDSGEAVFTDFRQTIYVDRLPPVVAVDSTATFGGSKANVDFFLRSLDKTATSVHTLLNLPANLTDAQILALVTANNDSAVVDRDLFKRGFSGIPNGNNVITAITYEITGNYNIQRLSGLSLPDGVGKGLGDLNHNNGFETGDVFGTSYGFEAVLYSQNAQFNPSADLNGDGKIDNNDLWLLRPTYVSAAAAQTVVNEARNAEVRRGNFNGDGVTDSRDVDYLYGHFGNLSWSLDMAADGGGAGKSDVDAMIHHVFLTEYGDVNLDGKIDVTDLGILATNWQTTSATWALADFTGDGIVDVTDLGLLATNWQFGVSGAGMSLDQAIRSVGLAGVSVPEPTALSLLLGVAWSLQRPRKKLKRF